MVEGGLPPQITRGKVKTVYPTKRVSLVVCVFIPILGNIEFFWPWAELAAELPTA